MLMVIIVAVLWLQGKERVEADAAAKKRLAEAQQRLNAAHAAYQAALTKLKTSPTDPTLKTAALQLGRAYAAMQREQQVATVYDEMALMNDISAATAAATAAPPTVEERLRQLAELQSKGLITPDEYVQRRQHLIAEV